MYGNQVTRGVRRFQRTYEDRALVFQRQIEDLIRERQHFQEQFQKLQPTYADEGQRLSYLDATIRYNINVLQQYSIDYNTVRENWRRLGEDYKIAEHRHSNEWARSMYDSAVAFFGQPDLHPTPLDVQFTQLIDDYRSLLEAVNAHEVRSDPNRRAGFEREATTSPETAVAAEHPAAAVRDETSPPHSDPGPLSGEEWGDRSVEQQSEPGPLSEEDRSSHDQDSSAAHTRQRYTVNDDLRQHYYTDQSAASSTGRYSLITTDAYVTSFRSPSAQQLPAPHRGVPVVQQLDFGDNTTLSASPPQQSDDEASVEADDVTTPGIMTYADGNVSATAPIVWHPTIGQPAHVTASASDRTAPLAAGFTRISIRPTRVAPLPPPASRRLAPVTSQTMTTTTITTTTTTLAGGRGPSSFFASGPKAVDTSVRLSTSAAAPTIEVPSAKESVSTFYRNATFHRDTKNTSQLVLKDLPIDPFDGEIRQYPKFRNRFLDVVEGHRDLAPRHKLQYLLQFLRGEPFELANNFQLTDENYFTVIDLLEERYGDPDVIRNLLMADLIGLRPPSPALADLRRFQGEAFRVIMDLKQLGDDVDSNRLYEQTLMSKLSPALKIELIRNTNYVKEKTATSVLNGLSSYIKVLNAVANSGVLWNSNGSPCPPGRRTPPRPGSPRQPSSTHHEPHAGYGAEAKAEDLPATDSRQNRKICAFCGLLH